MIMEKFKKSDRIIALVLALVLCLPFVFACGEKEETAQTTGEGAGSGAPAENGANGETAAQEEAPPATEKDTEPVEDVPDSGTIKLLGQDFETKGDWIGNYGSEGYVIAEENDEFNFMPAYAAMEFDGNQFYTWWDSESGKPAHEDDEELAAERENSALYTSPDKTAKIASCWYETNYFSLTVSVGDAPKKVTLYMNDFDSYSRSAEVTTKNKTGKTMKEPAEKVFFDTDEYIAGCYISYEVTGEIMFEFDCYSGNVVLSGVFFDPVS